jgi:hypothetical protein
MKYFSTYHETTRGPARATRRVSLANGVTLYIVYSMQKYGFIDAQIEGESGNLSPRICLHSSGFLGNGAIKLHDGFRRIRLHLAEDVARRFAGVDLTENYENYETLST